MFYFLHIFPIFSKKKNIKVHFMDFLTVILVCLKKRTLCLYDLQRLVILPMIRMV